MSLLLHLLEQLVLLAWVFPLVLLLEAVAARHPISAASRLHGAAMWAIYIVITAGVLTLTDKVKAVLGVRPLLEITAHGLAGAVIGSLLAVVIGDFFYYWCHRIQHRFFWRFHGVHHSIRELSVVGAYHHWTEELIRLPLLTIPVGLLAPESTRAPVIFALVALQTHYQHAPVRLHFGPFRRLISDNRYHRIHHSVEPQHHDRNFAATFPLWDMVFGTAHFPTAAEWPQTGLADRTEPDGLWDYLAWPFRQR